MRNLNRLARLLLYLLLAVPAYTPAQDTTNSEPQAMHAASRWRARRWCAAPEHRPARPGHTGAAGHYGFIPQAQAAALMRAMGTPPGRTSSRLIVPLGEERADWLVTVDYSASGYVKGR